MPHILRFRDIGAADVALVGGKNAALGEMYSSLAAAGVRVPNGFAITAEAYRETLAAAGAWSRLEEILRGLDAGNLADLAKRAAAARDLIHGAPLSPSLAAAILEGYAELKREYGEDVTLAVRSSATAEDLPQASFAGQHDSFLHVQGEAMLLEAVRRCFASLFNDRAVRYRIDQGFDHLKVLLSVGVMKMVRSDLASSGVAFSLDTESGFRDVVFATGAWGLGENVVQGAVDPDEFFVFKPTLAKGHREVLRRTLGAKKVKMVCVGGGDRRSTQNVPTSAEERARFCLADGEVVELAGLVVAIEKHLGERAGHPLPVDVEWAKDGVDGRLYIVQARPETVASRRSAATLVEYEIKGAPAVRIAGRAVGQKVATGTVRVVRDAAELARFRDGEVLVADTTSPDWGTVMKRASAIVTNRGGRTCHAAIVARELGIPAVVGAEGATERLRDGETVTVSCAHGTEGRVYEGAVAFSRRETDVSKLARPRTKILVNIGDPDLAFQLSFLPTEGVGLARMEFIVANHIKAHPMALLHPERIDDAAVREAIAELARNHASPADFFVERLSEGVATIAAAFYPRPVIVRMSDFKTNEYASLLGGRWFEPHEDNPMIGFRGASRYAHPAYAEGFALECAAMKRVRDAMGLDNVKLMIPFCRRVEEAERVVARMAELGLKRGDNGLEIYVMCEIPNNVILADAFSRVFDGFSIGSNDLTQLVLGVDRDSGLVAFDYEERDEGVKEMIRLAIAGAHRNRRPIGICGQAPSDYPEFAEFLVHEGIDSISLNPDSVLPTLRRIAALEAARPPVIRKDVARLVPPPNLPAVGGARTSFSWSEAARGLDGLPGGALNIAYEAVDRHALHGRGGHVAIRWLPREGAPVDITYEELRRRTNRFANVLRGELGLARGERLYVLCERTPELYVGVLGALKAGLVVCPLFSAFGPEPVRMRMELGDARAILTTESFYRRKVEKARASLPNLRHVLITGEPLERLMAEASDEFACEATRPEDGSFLHFTSGTTGTPKGAVHVHGAVVTHYATGKFALDLHAEDVFWCTADPGWVTGTSYGIVAPLLHGVTSIVDEADFDGERWYRILEEQAVTVWYTAPTAIRMLMKAGADLARAHRFPKLRLIASVGEPLNPEAVWWGADVLGLPIHDNWWQTETGGIMIANTPAMDIKPGSMGKPLPGVEAFVVHRQPDGGVKVVDAPGVEGELALKAGWPSMFRGYLGQEERYRKCFAGDLYLTGDLAKRDADGYFWFVGRADDVIKSAGHLIGPFEVESALMEHPAVAEAGVIGMPDPVVGEVVKAFVSLRKGFEPSEELRMELLGHARKKLGAAVAPKDIAFAASLPKTRSGKIMRRLIKSRELGLPEGDTSTLEAM